MVTFVVLDKSDTAQVSICAVVQSWTEGVKGLSKKPVGVNFKKGL